jgi:hypothetical protein
MLQTTPEAQARMSQRVEFISLRGPECDAPQRCPHFALFYTATLQEVVQAPRPEINSWRRNSLARLRGPRRREAAA